MSGPFDALIRSSGMDVSETCMNFIIDYVGVRTEGSSSQHKLPDREEVVLTTSKYFDPDLVKQMFDRALAEGKLIKQGPYHGTEVKDVL